MKKYLFGSVAFVCLLGGSAVAADLPLKAAPIVCPACDWNGYYVGVNLGGSIGRGRTDDSVSLNPPGIIGPGGTVPGVINPVSAVSATNSPAGLLGGAQIGFNKQTGNVVWGVEADWNWTGQRDTIQFQNFLASSTNVAPSTLAASDEQKLKWLATARARLGWAHDYFLWYVTGGVAWGKVESNYNFQDTGNGIFATAPASVSSSTTKAGWALGGGVETSLAWLGTSNRWSAKLEYLYVDLGTVNNTFTVPVTAVPGAAYTYNSSSHIQDHIVRVGLNYRLGGTDRPSTQVASAACPTCDWRGFYIGANLGGSIGRDRTDDSISLNPPGVPGVTAPGVINPVSAVSATNSPAGLLGGAQIGFNWQTGHWVIGAEGDWDLTSQRDRIDRSNFLASSVNVAPAVMTYSDEQKIKWLATARARLGWAQGCFLWYVTGGAAFGQVESNYNFQVVQTGGIPTLGTAPTAAGFSKTKTGWTVGSGVETVLPWLGNANRWSAKLEYLFVDLGTVDNTFNVPVTGLATAYTYTSSSRIQDHIVRVGLNYRFGG